MSDVINVALIIGGVALIGAVMFMVGVARGITLRTREVTTMARMTSNLALHEFARVLEMDSDGLKRLIANALDHAGKVKPAASRRQGAAVSPRCLLHDIEGPCSICLLDAAHERWRKARLVAGHTPKCTNINCDARKCRVS